MIFVCAKRDIQIGEELKVLYDKKYCNFMLKHESLLNANQFMEQKYQGMLDTT